MGLFSKGSNTEKIEEHLKTYLIEGETIEYLQASLVSYVCVTNKRFIIDPKAPEERIMITIPFNKVTGVSFAKLNTGEIILETSSSKFELLLMNGVEAYSKISEKII